MCLKSGVGIVDVAPRLKIIALNAITMTCNHAYGSVTI